MSNFQAVYYRDPHGNMPVSDAIDTLAPACQESVDWTISLLNDLHEGRPHLPFPYSSALKGVPFRAFRELRCECGRRHHRVIFRRSRQLLVLLHIVLNKAAEIPEADMYIALDRWNDFIRRMDEIPRTPPRAAGTDAP